jgi:hypothetical protein
MLRNIHYSSILLLLCGLAGSPPALAVGDNFATDPLLNGSPWSFGAGSNVNSQFTWSPGALAVHLNSSMPTARLDLPLGTTLGDSSSFLLSARFSFTVTSAPGDQSAQIAFGLSNHTVTGGDRTGTLGNFSSDNTYDTFEFNYFPNVSPSFGGPDLTQAIFGGPGDGDAFSNFAPSVFEPYDLGHHAQGITSLPQATTLEAHLAYDGVNKLVTITMYQVAGNGSLTLLDTELPQLDLTDPSQSGYDFLHPFQLNSLSIAAYQDGFTTSEDPSLVANVTFQNISLTLVPEPSTAVLTLLSSVLLLPLFGRLRPMDRDRSRSRRRFV